MSGHRIFFREAQSKQQNRTQTTSSTVLGTPQNRTRTKNSPSKSFEAVALLVGFSTGSPPKIGTFTAWNRTRNHTRTPPDSWYILSWWHELSPRL